MHRKKIFHEISWCWVPTICVKNILPYLVTYNWPKCAEIHVIILSSQRKRRIKDISFFDQGYAVRHTQNTHGFSSSHVWMWELDYKESWAPNNWCFWTVVLEKTFQSPLGCKKIQPVHPKGNQSWVFIAGTDVEAETPVLCPPDAKRWLTGKESDAGKDWRREEKGTTEDEMIGWHHRLDGRTYSGM